MIFVIPIILGAAALITGGAGVAAGVDGVSKLKKAKKVGEAAQRRYERKQRSVEDTFQATQNLAEEYGQLQLQVTLQTIGRFVQFIERIGQRASQSKMEFLEGVAGFSPQQLQDYKAATLEAEQVAAGILKAAGTAYAAGQGTVALVGLFGTASTGTAIGSLSGAAAWNATLAWLGGGSLAAGGGGMALGTLVLGGITVGPALMIGGFVLGGQGEKALTEARHFEAKVNTEIAKLDVFEEFLKQVQQRILELRELVSTLNNRAIAALSELESRVFMDDALLSKDAEELERGAVNFIPERDAAPFQQVALLIKALSEIMKIPVLDAEGKLNQDATDLNTRYLTI